MPGDQVHVQCGNVTLRAPRRRPNLKRHPLSGTEGGGSDDDAIERSPRPEDIPEERTTTSEGVIVTPSRPATARPTVYTTVTAPTTNPPTSAGNTNISTTVGSILEEPVTPRGSVVPQEDFNHSDIGSDSDISPEVRSARPDLGDDKRSGQEIPNSAFGSSKPEVSTSPSGISTPGIVNIGGGGQNISRLDDEAWISPVIDDITSTHVSDDNFRSDRNRNRNLSGNLTVDADVAAGDGNAASDAGPRSTKRPLVPTIGKAR